MPNDSTFLLVSSAALPEIYLKVVEAKKLLSNGQAKTAAEAARMTGISRSAFTSTRIVSMHTTTLRTSTSFRCTPYCRTVPVY